MKDNTAVRQHKLMAMGEPVNDGLKVDTARGVHFEGPVARGSTQKHPAPKAPSRHEHGSKQRGKF